MNAILFTSCTHYKMLMDYYHTLSLKHCMQTVHSADEFLMVHQRSKISELHEKALRIMDGAISINLMKVD